MFPDLFSTSLQMFHRNLHRTSSGRRDLNDVRNSLISRQLTRIEGINIQQEINKLEEIILNSSQVPMSRRVLLDEEQLLDQLDLVRLNLPSVFQEATDLLLHKEEVLLEAEQYAQEIIASAEQQAAQILDEIGLIHRAETEAWHIRQYVEQDCVEMKQQVLSEIDQMRHQAQQDLLKMQQSVTVECKEIQRDADKYADDVLSNMERQLEEMMRIVRNGRQSQTQPRSSSNRQSLSNKNQAIETLKPEKQQNEANYAQDIQDNNDDESLKLKEFNQLQQIVSSTKVSTIREIQNKRILKLGDRMIAFSSGGAFLGGLIAQIPGAIVGALAGAMFGLFETARIANTSKNL